MIDFFKPYAENLLKNKKIPLIIFIGLLGMLLIAFGSFAKPTEKKEDTAKEFEAENLYETEKELAEFLGKINGAGEVRVMVSMDSGKESVFALDTSENSSKSNGEKEEIKKTDEHIIIKTGSNENGLELKKIYPKIRGIAVICSGGNSPVIKEQITSLLCALFDINSTQVSVAEMAS